MISRELPPLALAHCLVRARFGFWSDDVRVFFPSYRYPGQGLANRWGLVTKEANDLGTVHVTFEGERIVSFRFSHPWPKVRFHNGRSHLMGKEFQLLVAGVVGSAECPVKIFKAVRASDGLKLQSS
jgi:hypothetical protein